MLPTLFMNFHPRSDAIKIIDEWTWRRNFFLLVLHLNHKEPSRWIKPSMSGALNFAVEGFTDSATSFEVDLSSLQPSDARFKAEQIAERKFVKSEKASMSGGWSRKEEISRKKINLRMASYRRYAVIERRRESCWKLRTRTQQIGLKVHP